MIDRLEVASELPGIDLVSVEQVEVDIDLAALLFDRTHIESIRVSGVGFDTPETMAKSPAPAQAAEVDGEDEGALESLVPELPTPESLLASADLETVKVYQKAESEITQMVTKWQGVATGDVLSEGKLAELQQDFQSLQEQSESGDATEMLALATEIKAFQEKVSDFKSEIDRIRNEVGTDRARVAALYDEMQAAKDADYNRLKSAYELSTGGVQGIVGAIVEQQLQQQIAELAGYYEMVEPYLQSEEEPPVPPRGQGRWVKYAMDDPRPDLWIAETEISGVLEGQAFDARITDISDQQKLLGRPIKLTLQSDGPTISNLFVEAEDNRLGPEVVNQVNFRSAGFKLAAMEMEALALESGTLAFDGAFTLAGLEQLTGETAVTMSDASVSLVDTSGMMGLVETTLNEIDSFTANIDLGGTLLRPAVDVETDLDAKLAEGMQASVSQEALAYTDDLKAQLDAQTGDKLGSLKGSAGDMAGIDKLLDDRLAALTDLSSSAGSLSTGGGSGLLKKLFN
jgi:uncharacterized protein (TIGR03545 family)